MLALAAEPLASLVDTYFIADLGPVELAAVGVSVSIFNLVSKVFNFPLLSVTTSFVAEDGALGVNLGRVPLRGQQQGRQELSATKSSGQDDSEALLPAEWVQAPRPVVPAISAALVLATVLGVAEALIMSLASGPILHVMGVPVASAMRAPAQSYLSFRALGAPAVVLAMATQGVFRGFKDTRTPLFSTVAGSAVNILLDPVLMFACGLGISGAAIATVASQYLIAGVLLWSLAERVTLLPPQLRDLRFDRFLKSGGLLLGRTLALLSTMTLATSMAARQGTTPMAAHQICAQIWLASSLLSDSLALAGQTLLASSFAQGDARRVKAITFRTLQLGLAMGLTMAIILSVGASTFPRIFTQDAGVLAAMAVIMPFVAATQPITSMAFVFDGLHYGASDFSYAAVAMILSSIPCVVVLLMAPHLFGLAGVWMGLTLIMSLRMFVGFARIGTKSGPWRLLKGAELPAVSRPSSLKGLRVE
eukprot:SM000004S15147  [mRNA]  locus=s4:1564768:1569020:+ [translate_table: standard]